ncbi:phage tail tip lysozyme [Devosia sp. A369]
MAKLNAEQVFRAKAPAIMAQLIRDFPITPVDAAAILGNLGHESAGLTILQEIKPTVPGSKGGYGWAQWTGPRRHAFEAYCARTGKDPASDEANYAYLFLELKGIEGSEKAAIGKLVAAKGLDAKVEAFERAFLRAGVKHYPSRKQWAAVALDAWRAKGSTGIPIPKPTPEPQRPPETAKPERGRAVPIIVAVATLAALAAAFFFVRF